MLNRGVKEVLQTLLGHRSIKTTEIYANWVRKEGCGGGFSRMTFGVIWKSAHSLLLAFSFA